MMKRWGLEGMRSFAQDSVAAKENARTAASSQISDVMPTPANAEIPSQA